VVIVDSSSAAIKFAALLLKDKFILTLPRAH
jgi:hypothetical protein